MRDHVACHLRQQRRLLLRELWQRRHPGWLVDRAGERENQTLAIYISLFCFCFFVPGSVRLQCQADSSAGRDLSPSVSQPPSSTDQPDSDSGHSGSLRVRLPDRLGSYGKGDPTVVEKPAKGDESACSECQLSSSRHTLSATEQHDCAVCDERTATTNHRDASPKETCLVSDQMTDDTVISPKETCLVSDQMTDDTVISPKETCLVSDQMTDDTFISPTETCLVGDQMTDDTVISPTETCLVSDQMTDDTVISPTETCLVSDQMTDDTVISPTETCLVSDQMTDDTVISPKETCLVSDQMTDDTVISPTETCLVSDQMTDDTVISPKETCLVSDQMTDDTVISPKETCLVSDQMTDDTVISPTETCLVSDQMTDDTVISPTETCLVSDQMTDDTVISPKETCLVSDQMTDDTVISPTETCLVSDQMTDDTVISPTETCLVGDQMTDDTVISPTETCLVSDQMTDDTVISPTETCLVGDQMTDDTVISPTEEHPCSDYDHQPTGTTDHTDASLPSSSTEEHPCSVCSHTTEEHSCSVCSHTTAETDHRDVSFPDSLTEQLSFSFDQTTVTTDRTYVSSTDQRPCSVLDQPTVTTDLTDDSLKEVDPCSVLDQPTYITDDSLKKEDPCSVLDQPTDITDDSLKKVDPCSVLDQPTDMTDDSLKKEDPCSACDQTADIKDHTDVSPATDVSPDTDVSITDEHVCSACDQTTDATDHTDVRALCSPTEEQPCSVCDHTTDRTDVFPTEESPCSVNNQPVVATDHMNISATKEQPSSVCDRITGTTDHTDINLPSSPKEQQPVDQPAVTKDHTDVFPTEERPCSECDQTDYKVNDQITVSTDRRHVSPATDPTNLSVSLTEENPCSVHDMTTSAKDHPEVSPAEGCLHTEEQSPADKPADISQPQAVTTQPASSPEAPDSSSNGRPRGWLQFCLCRDRFVSGREEASPQTDQQFKGEIPDASSSGPCPTPRREESSCRDCDHTTDPTDGTGVCPKEEPNTGSRLDRMLQLCLCRKRAVSDEEESPQSKKKESTASWSERKVTDCVPPREKQDIVGGLRSTFLHFCLTYNGDGGDREDDCSQAEGQSKGDSPAVTNQPQTVPFPPSSTKERNSFKVFSHTSLQFCLPHKGPVSAGGKNSPQPKEDNSTSSIQSMAEAVQKDTGSTWDHQHGVNEEILVKSVCSLNEVSIRRLGSKSSGSENSSSITDNDSSITGSESSSMGSESRSSSPGSHGDPPGTVVLRRMALYCFDALLYHLCDFRYVRAPSFANDPYGREDPRFAPVTLEEMDDLHCTVSVLTHFESGHHCLDWEVGVHGVVMVRASAEGPVTASFLPEVARDNGKQEPLLSVVKRRKLSWFGHVNRHDSLAKTILQGTVERGRRRGRQRKAWADNAKEWTGETFNSLLQISED
ncbi:hypothetical protein ACOMHN_064013 [Nucella lapillus]